ncbi:MAG: nitroreductase family protein [Muribaculaceae bacterium]|nr:nitroreductase family protein [Muribaculaceae bacterium]
MKKRATVRAFSAERHVDDATLDSLLEAACHAPSTGNMQLYSVVVTTDVALKQRLAELHFGQPVARNCDALLTFCADTRRFGKWCDARRADRSLDNAGGRLTAIIDATIFAQQFVTLAELSGIGTCYLGAVTYNVKGFAEALNLPSDGTVIPLFSVAVGYPDGQQVFKPSDRLPLAAVVSRNTYHDPSQAEIDSWYAAKEAMDESARFIAENGKQTLAQVYSEVRYPRELNMSLGRQLLELINAR